MLGSDHKADYPEAVMSEYIAGFNDGYGYVLAEIERNPRMTTAELIRHLKGEKVEIGPGILPAREKERNCD